MRAQNHKLLGLVAILLLVLTANVVLAQNGGTQVGAASPVVTSAADCTVIVNPGQSIQKAIAPARSGAVICVRQGVYTEQLKITKNNVGITLMAYPGERPILDGEYRLPVLTTKNKFAPLIVLKASDVTLDGFEIRRSNLRGITVSKGNVTLRNLIVRDSKGAGIVINGTTTVPVRNILVENSIVYNNLLNNASGAAGGSALTFIEVHDSTARGNVVYHNYGEGLVAGRRSRNILFEGNTTYDNRGANIYLVNTTNPTVRRNFVFCTDDPISWRGNGDLYRPGPGLQLRDENFKKPQPPPSSGQTIVNNIVVGCGSNFGVATQIAGGGLNNALVAHNTFVNARSAGGDGANNIEIGGNVSLSNTRFVNNVVLQSVPGTITRIQYALGTPNLSSFTVSHNVYSQTPGNGWVSSEPGRIIGNPMLVNPVMPALSALPQPANYALLNGSPAIDNGTNSAGVTEDFFTNPRTGTVDIGADELGGSTTFAIIGDLLPLAEVGE